MTLTEKTADLKLLTIMDDFDKGLAQQLMASRCIHAWHIVAHKRRVLLKKMVLLIN